MTPDALICSANIAAAALSALRDDMLPADDAARLRDHIALCRACQAYMAEYDMLAHALRQPCPPEMLDELWRSVMREHEQQPRRNGLSPRAAWLGSAAVALVAFVVALASVAPHLRSIPSHQGTPAISTIVANNPTAMPTTAVTVVLPSGPPLQGPSAVWQVVTLPQSFSAVNSNGFTLSVAPSNPNVAYVCNTIAPSQPVPMMVTRDRGAHWTRTADVPRLTRPCGNIIVDADDPDVLVVQNEASLDGGASWHALNGQAALTLADLASWHGHYYALIGGHVECSTDGMQTWQRIDQIVGEPITNFWLNPASGNIAIATTPSSAPERTNIWIPQSDGKWDVVNLSAPVTLAAPVDTMDWIFCSGNPMNNPTNPTFLCGPLNAQAWQQLPALNASVQTTQDLIAVDSTGTVYLEGVTTQTHLYRLLPGATRWNDLGALPAGMASASVFPNANGVMWAFPANMGARNQIATAGIP